MARTPAVALTAMILSSMALLALASVPVVKNKATQPNAARKLLAIQPTYWQFNPGFGHDSKGQPASDAAAALPVQADSLNIEAAAVSDRTAAEALPFRRLQASTPTFDRDLEDRSAAVANPTLAAAVKRLEADAAVNNAGASAAEALPFRRLHASTPTFDRDLEDRSAAVANPTLAAAVKRLEADTAASGARVTANEVLPFRRLQASTPTFDRDLEDRSAAVANPTLAAAVKRLEADSATGSASTSAGEALPFRRLQASTPTFDRDLEDRSAAVANPTLAAAVKRLEADSATGSASTSAGEALPFRRLQASTPTFDRDLEDRSAAVANLLLQSAYKRFEAAQAVDNGSTGTPFRRLLAVPVKAISKAAALPTASH